MIALPALAEKLKKEKSVALIIHVRPDGDCIGSGCALKLALQKAGVKAEVFCRDDIPSRFFFLEEPKKIRKDFVVSDYTALVAVDCADLFRLGDYADEFRAHKNTFNIDHHISNRCYAGVNIVEADASSTCEVLYCLMSEDEKFSNSLNKANITDAILSLENDKKLEFEIARALYIGIIFDTGVFRYSNTSKKTMEIAGKLIETGIPFWKYIDECFLQRTYTQTQLLGRTLLASMRVMDGKCIVATITRRMMEFYEAKTEDIEGIIDQLRITQGVEVAILLHEIGDQEYKVSLRSNNYIDVSKIASFFGGGGHVKAAGFTMRGSAHDVVNNITGHIESQMFNK